jgi:hypothetical protein
MVGDLFQSVVCAAKDQVSSNLGNEVVILHVQSGNYYGLNEVGSRIWSLIQKPQAVAAIRKVLLAEYDVQLSQLDNDLNTVLQQLLSKGLIEVCDEAVA